MRAAIEKARILDESMITDGVIAVGSAVTLKNLSTQSNDVQNRSLLDVLRGCELPVKQSRRTLHDLQAVR